MWHVTMSTLTGFSWGWDALVAIGTLALATVTAGLAWTTRALARASRDDERAQWRPVLVPAVRAPVRYDDATGDMSFEVRNVGRGPAFGVNAQLRSGKKGLGASNPETSPATIAPGENFLLESRVIEPSSQLRGWVVDAEIHYYDITERWHRSIFTIVGRKPIDKLTDPSVTPELEVGRVFVYETDQHVLPVLGSPRAIEEQAREQRRMRHRVRALATRLSRGIRDLMAHAFRRTPDRR